MFCRGYSLTSFLLSPIDIIIKTIGGKYMNNKETALVLKIVWLIRNNRINYNEVIFHLRKITNPEMNVYRILDRIDRHLQEQIE